MLTKHPKKSLKTALGVCMRCTTEELTVWLFLLIDWWLLEA